MLPLESISNLSIWIVAGITGLGVVLVVAMLGIFQAILTRRLNAAEKSLLEREKKFQPLRDEITEGIWLLRRFLAMHVGGYDVSPEMVLEGNLYVRVNATKAESLLKENGMSVLDVRSVEEFGKNRIPGAINIPKEELEKNISSIPRTEGLLVYGATGKDGEDVCQFVSARGFFRLFSLQDGFHTWTGRTVSGEKK